MIRPTSTQQTSDDHVLKIFLGEIVRQTDFALVAARDLAHSAVGGAERSGDERVWYSAQALLVAVANVSKLIWPAYRKNEQRLSDRGLRLQQLLGADNLGALESKDLRNDFEHFDSRLEDWAVTVPGRPFIDGNVNAHLVLRDIPPDRWLRNLDTEKWALTFRGKEYLLTPVVEALNLARGRAIIATGALGQGKTS